MKGREALIVTFWTNYELHERSHQSETFQPLFRRALDLCENGNEEIAYDIEAARHAKEAYAAKA